MSLSSDPYESIRAEREKAERDQKMAESYYEARATQLKKEYLSDKRHYAKLIKHQLQRFGESVWKRYLFGIIPLHWYKVRTDDPLVKGFNWVDKPIAAVYTVEGTSRKYHHHRYGYFVALRETQDYNTGLLGAKLMRITGDCIIGYYRISDDRVTLLGHNEAQAHDMDIARLLTKFHKEALQRKNRTTGID